MCSYNNLTTLPFSLFSLPSLRTLSIIENKLSSLSEKIGNLSNLVCLRLGGNKLTSLPDEIGNLSQLETLYVSNNKLTQLPTTIGNLSHLTFLCCQDNKLTHFPDEIVNLVKLKTVYTAYNKLTHFPPVYKSNYLNLVDCSNNQISSLPADIGQCKHLEGIFCSHNMLSHIPKEIGTLVRLKELNFSNNCLTALPSELGQLVGLKYLTISNNRLTTLPSELGQLQPTIRSVIYSGNPIEYIPPNLMRMLGLMKQVQGVYTDTQSVHNTDIQKTVTKSINNLLSIVPVYKLDAIISQLLEDTVLSTTTKESLVEYSKDKCVHSVLKITFSELLVAVWNRIVSFDIELQKKIKMTMNTEMQDSLCMCFTGRISRLVNCLNGYDELVCINISDGEQIGNIILSTKEQVYPYSVEKHRKLVFERLTELGYAQGVIDEWIMYIE